MSNTTALDKLVNQPYKHGFVTDIESESAPKGLSEDTIRMISAKKNEPDWLLEFRLKAYRHWLTMTEPAWANVHYPKIDFQNIIYFSAPKPKKLKSMDEVDPELLRTFEKLGVPMNERAALAGVAVDVIFDSVSVATTYKQKLADVGIIFCSISEAVREHPELVKQIHGQRGAGGRQLLRRAQLRGVHRRLVLLYSQGRQMPDGAVDVFPHQYPGIGTVRAHADHRRRRRLGVLSRRLHRAQVRHQPAACGGGGTGGARARRHQVLDGAELVRGRRERQGRDLQFRDQARPVQRAPTPKYRGPRSRPDRRSPGNTRRAFCSATIR